MSDDRQAKDRIRKDAEGQFAPNQGDRKASGVASAKPTVITGQEDATDAKNPGQKKGPGDWDINYDERDTDKPHSDH
ncbi:hypothetical protein M2360_004328 [Rhizobium sp. SG_E_25_P2]|jgi:hypothetical protein|uniref:hypothetical protein n=1 Tax=Rhizobium sp. SG_E_25_P2 TaxID=2879942 RepID=UPI0024755E38|nr:hypothetical protein [Rhizobium sp. SG_E_25_P2]MDH6268909.1 hypothetical protein [Rhizobium sp. SG_E_25_P2]